MTTKPKERWVLWHGQYYASYPTLEQCLELLIIRINNPLISKYPHADNDGLHAAYRHIEEIKADGRFKRGTWSVCREN